MDFNDPRWSDLRGGYRVPYDPRNALRKLERGEDTEAAWNELWNELHHQGDIGEASYAAVPQLVRIYAARGIPDWNAYALVATIEEVRHNGRNAELPSYLRDAYESAWRQLGELGLRELQSAQEPTLVTSIIAVLAYWKGQRTLGLLASSLTEDERLELLTESGIR
jgi:hypothetical protein